MSALDAQAIARALRTERVGRSLEVREQSGSTNDDARAAADAGAPDGHVVIADAQRAGRGASGRSWSSPPGTDLYVSILARLDVAPQRIAPLTLAIGAAVARAVESFLERAPTQSPVEIKWPNDVLVGGAKCAGILVESASVGARLERAVIGIGLNINRARFEGDLAVTATSMRIAAGHRFDRIAVLAALLLEVERAQERFSAHGIGPDLAALENRLAYRGAEVTCGAIRGTLVGLAEDGALLIASGGEPHRVVTGTLRPQ